ncbi:MAG: hypothetical protein JW940_22165 [Polyangiaceae bacterium]|nr:hypothetical protein [Polyangiaceae bacterium]
MDDLGSRLDLGREESLVRSLQRDQRSTAGFDRLAFALRAVQLLRPHATDVAVYRSTHLHVVQGRDLSRGGEARWAIVGIPNNASAEAVALALLELTDLSQRPLALELALAEAVAVEQAS